MSLLEELFLEEEAGEAERLERVLEGGEGEGRDDSDEDERGGEDEAEEEKTRVDPTKPKSVRVVKNPRVILNPARLTGPRGIQTLTSHFKDFKFKGKGHEKEDLDVVLKKLEHWAHRLYPRFQFDDCLKKIELLGKKRPVMVQLNKIRSDQIISSEFVNQKDSSDDEAPPPPPPEEDEFDKLLQQQIEIARATPGPSSAKKAFPNTPALDRSTLMPKATSSPSISDEQKQRMMKNRQMAEERRLARMRQNVNGEKITDTTNKLVDLTNFNPAEKLIPRTIMESQEENENDDNENVIDMTDDNEVTKTATHKEAAVITSDEEMSSNINRKTKKNKRILRDSSDDENESIDLKDNRELEIDSISPLKEARKTENIVKEKANVKPSVSYDSSNDEMVMDVEDISNEEHSKKISNVETDSSDTDIGGTAKNPKDGIKSINCVAKNHKDCIQSLTVNSSEEININYSDNSDDECEIITYNTSIQVDIHKNATQSSQNEANFNNDLMEKIHDKSNVDENKDCDDDISNIDENVKITGEINNKPSDRTNVADIYLSNKENVQANVDETV